MLFYDQAEGRFGVNREKTTLDSREQTSGIQEGTLDLDGEPLKLRIFIDRSLIEAYASGLKSLTTRAYPSRSDADGLLIWADGDLNTRSIEI